MGSVEKNFAKDIHELEASAIVEFYDVYYDEINNPNAVFKFHSCLNSFGINNQIKWKGEGYFPIPVEGEGWEAAAGNQKLPRPRLKFSNADYFISNLIKNFNRLLNAKVIRTKVYLKYIDASNFSGGVNPYGFPDSNAGVKDMYFISRVVSESKYAVEFELVSALELENVKVPNRQILGRYCPFAYRGSGCGYSGTPKETSRGVPFVDTNGAAINMNTLTDKGQWNSTSSYVKGDFVWKNSKTIKNRGVNPYDVEYLKIYYVCRADHAGSTSTDPFLRSDLWVKDDCSRRLQGCRARFATNLKFGGFAGTSGFGN